jgi:hypothetical protein
VPQADPAALTVVAKQAQRTQKPQKLRRESILIGFNESKSGPRDQGKGT